MLLEFLTGQVETGELPSVEFCMSYIVRPYLKKKKKTKTKTNGPLPSVLKLGFRECISLHMKWRDVLGVENRNGEKHSYYAIILIVLFSFSLTLAWFLLGVVFLSHWSSHSPFSPKWRCLSGSWMS
jgi:hypothetical protein